MNPMLKSGNYWMDVNPANQLGKARRQYADANTTVIKVDTIPLGNISRLTQHMIRNEAETLLFFFENSLNMNLGYVSWDVAAWALPSRFRHLDINLILDVALSPRHLHENVDRRSQNKPHTLHFT